MRIFLFIVFLTPLQFIYSQHNSHEDETHSHKFEFGGALGPVFSVHEEAFTGSLHTHVIRNLGHENRFGVGLGFETLFDEHKHINISIPVNYNTGVGLVFTVSPGILWKNESVWERGPSIHMEALYEFMFEHFHIGPMFEIAMAKSDIHIMLGIHFAIGWGE